MEQRPTLAEINLGNLRENFIKLKTYVGDSLIMPILKADAYGHDLIKCAKELEKLNPWGFGLAFLEEAVTLRKAGIKSPILTLGGISGRQIKYFLEHDIDLCASSISKLESIDSEASKAGKVARVHIKIDTGMERIGVHHYSCKPLLEKVLELENIELVSIFSHFADAENEDQSFTKTQLKRFLDATKNFKNRQGNCPLLHIANTPGILASKDNHLDMVRLGMSLFGVSSRDETKHQDSLNLKPVLRLTSEVCYFKVVKPGATVSYGRTWEAKEQTRVVTIPLGYGDGYPRGLSNKARVLIRGKSYPIVGRVCMDQFMVNIGPEGEAYNSDEVVLLGRQGEEEITVRELAHLADTDERDLLLRIALRIPKKFVS